MQQIHHEAKHPKLPYEPDKNVNMHEIVRALAAALPGRPCRPLRACPGAGWRPRVAGDAREAAPPVGTLRAPWSCCRPCAPPPAAALQTGGVTTQGVAVRGSIKKK